MPEGGIRMLISQYISSNKFKEFDDKLVEKLIWLGAKMGFRAVKRKHGGMLVMVSRKKIKSNYEKILNNRLDYSAGRYAFAPEVEDLIIHYGIEDGAILIDRKGKLIDNNCALPLDFKKNYDYKRTHGGVRRSTAINVTKRFKALALMIRSNGLVTIVYQGMIRGIIRYTETSWGNIVPLVDNVRQSSFPEYSSFPTHLKNKVLLPKLDKFIQGMGDPYAAKLDYYKERTKPSVDWEPDRSEANVHYHNRESPVKYKQSHFGDSTHVLHQSHHILDNVSYIPPGVPENTWDYKQLEYIYKNGITPAVAAILYERMRNSLYPLNLKKPLTLQQNLPQKPLMALPPGQDWKPAIQKEAGEMDTNGHIGSFLSNIYSILNRFSRKNEPSRSVRKKSFPRDD
jgi:hypothetical protein